LIGFRSRLFRALPPVVRIADGIFHVHLYEHAMWQGVDNYQARLRNLQTFGYQQLQIAWLMGATQGH
jgi:hypothetical protein